tara:strand:- start:603 stop:806 length:204 start_codon:yes stop_codon:yes gene_type:complete
MSQRRYQKNYENRNRDKKGLVQITIWVPADQSDEFKQLAATARKPKKRNKRNVRRATKNTAATTETD